MLIAIASGSVCINKCDLNAEQAQRIREIAGAKGAPMLAEIPFDEEVRRLLMEGRILAAGTGAAARAVRSLATGLARKLARGDVPV